MKDILKQKYPAKAHINSVVQTLSKTTPLPPNSIIYLEGTKSEAFPDSDLEVPFRQSRYFYYVTGCAEPDCAFSYDVTTEKSTLFIPAPPNERSLVFNGPGLTVEEAKRLYDVDKVQMVSSIIAHLSLARNKTIWTMEPSDYCSSAGIAQPTSPLLKTAFNVCRFSKDEYEVELLREANRVSGIAHVAVMRATRHARNERELKSVFVSHCIALGCDEQAYGPIVAAGTNGATLHYMKDNADIDSSMLNLLIDAGAEYGLYASDITRTFPINGKFDKRSGEIYALVLKMQKAAIEMLKPGVLWQDCSEKAHSIMIDGLLKLDILRGDAKEILEAGVERLLLPHGLGHHIGMECHDGTLQERKGGKKEEGEVGLVTGSVVTVEPGIYLNRRILEPACSNPKYSKFINKDVLSKYWDVGGVRIEDCILITKDGYENLTDVPKEIDEIERIVSGEEEEDEWQLIEGLDVGGKAGHSRSVLV